MMRLLIAGVVAVSVSFVGAAGQTTCSLQHSETGVHICFPPDGGPNQMSPILHISAQINAPSDKLIQEFTILVDGAAVGQERERVPTPQVSVEGNLGSPLLPGKHLVTIKAPEVGEANAKIVVAESELTFPCDPVTNFPQWSCVSRPAVRGSKEVFPLSSLRERNRTKGGAPYEEYERIVLDELEALQLDSMELAAYDNAGQLYVATHVHSDIEVRRYSAGGQKLEFATIVSSCGPGFTALDAIAVDDQGHIWIGGHSSACFHASEQAFQKTSATTRKRVRSFVLSLSTHPGAAPPLRYFTYLSPAGEERIHAIQVDNLGNAHLAGAAASLDFPHEKLLIVNKEPRSSSQLSFLAILNADGSALLHSTLLRGVTAQSLYIGRDKNIFIAGQTAASDSVANSKPNHASHSVAKLSSTAACCALFAAALRADLSAVTSTVLIGSEPIHGRVSLAITEIGEIVLIAPTANFARSRGEFSKPSGRSLYVLTAASLGQQCSKLLSGNLPPSLVTTTAIESFAGDASSPICAMRGR